METDSEDAWVADGPVAPYRLRESPNPRHEKGNCPASAAFQVTRSCFRRSTDIHRFHAASTSMKFIRPFHWLVLLTQQVPVPAMRDCQTEGTRFLTVATALDEGPCLGPRRYSGLHSTGGMTFTVVLTWLACGYLIVFGRQYATINDELVIAPRALLLSGRNTTRFSGAPPRPSSWLALPINYPCGGAQFLNHLFISSLSSLVWGQTWSSLTGHVRIMHRGYSWVSLCPI